MLARLGSAVCVAMLLGACSAIPELTFVADDGDGGTTLPDGAIDPKKCPGGGPEICDDGVDNDCDGKVDCADSDCMPTYSCQDAPADWTVVGFSAATRPNCPAAAPSTDLAVSSGDGTATCSCNCVGTGGSCASGSYTLSLSNELTCGIAATTRTVPLTGSCTKLATSFAVPVGAFAKIDRPNGPTSCEPNSPLNGPITNGRLCQAARFGKGCGSGEVCAPRPTAGTAVCVTKIGANACPTGYGKKSSAGTSAVDQRTCTGCTCGAPTACAGGSLSIYDGDMCRTMGNGNGATGIGASCADASDDDFTATHFTATAPTGGCSGTPLTPAVPGPGALSFVNARTVCCK